MAVGEGIGDEAAQEGGALDQLGGRLQQQQSHADRDHQVDRPADQAAGVLRHLAGSPRVHEQRPGRRDQHDAERAEKNQDAEDVDPVARPGREAVGEEVDAHMGVLQEGIAGAEHEHRGEEIPLDLQQGVRAHVEGLAHDGVAGGEDDRRQDQPDDGFADEIGESVDHPGKFEQGIHEPPVAAASVDGPEFSGVRLIRNALLFQSYLH